MDANTSLEFASDVCELSREEVTLVSGGMMDLHQDGPHPGEQTPGRLVSTIGYRTIADYGL